MSVYDRKLRVANMALRNCCNVPKGCGDKLIKQNKSKYAIGLIYQPKSCDNVFPSPNRVGALSDLKCY